jgi:hypothetical protein
VAVILLALWVGGNLRRLNKNAVHALADAEENRAYVGALIDFVGSHPDIQSFMYDGTPSAFQPWGIKGALQYLHHGNEVQLTDVHARQNERPAASVAILKWDAMKHSVRIVVE